MNILKQIFVSINLSKKFFKTKILKTFAHYNLYPQLSPNLFLILISIFLLTLFSGCIQKGSPTSYLTKDQIGFIQQSYPYSNNCTVMICEYNSTLLKIKGWISGLFSNEEVQVPNLYQKVCSFKYYDIEKEDDFKELNDLTGLIRKSEMQSGSSSSPQASQSSSFSQSGSKLIQPVMIGIGDTIAAGDDFFSTCNGHLGINMIDISNMPQTINNQFAKTKLKNVNKCILEGGAIPFYKFGRLLPSQYGDFANNTKDKGPAFVSPGYEYNKSSYDKNILSPLGAFYTIKSNCPNCLVTATVKYGDLDTLDYYKQYEDWDSIDVIAFTANLSLFNSCDPMVVIQNETNSLKSFAQNITQRYHKPIVIITSVNEGMNSANQCRWTNISIAKFYDYLVRSIPDLVSSGVIGIVASDSSSLPKEAYNSFGFFCSIYYSSHSPNFNFATYAIFSKEGDIPSACGMYQLSTSMFILGETLNYSNLLLTPAIKEEKCISSLNYDLSELALSNGLFSNDTCKKDSLLISSISSKYFVDNSIYMALLNYLGYYSDYPSQTNLNLKQYEKHCSCNYTENQKERELCCLVQTMQYYQNETLQKNSNIGEGHLAYFIVYGTIYGESSYNTEFKNYSSYYYLSSDQSLDQDNSQNHIQTIPIISFDSIEQKMEQKNQNKYISKYISKHIMSTDSNNDSLVLNLQSDTQCEIWYELCHQANNFYYCFRYDVQCSTQQPPQPTLPEPTLPQPTLPQPTLPKPTFQLNPTVKSILQTALAIRDVCK